MFTVRTRVKSSNRTAYSPTKTRRRRRRTTSRLPVQQQTFKKKNLTPHTLLPLSQLFACAINAACAALLDAGVPLQNSFSAMTCCLLTPEGSDQACLVLDPSAVEEQVILSSIWFGKVDAVVVVF
jgi:hypothetical protein